MRIGEFLFKTTLVQTTMARVLSEYRLMVFLCIAAVCSIGVAAQSITPPCQPGVSNRKTVVTEAQRKAAGNKAIPPITDRQNGFAWPDSEFGVFKNDTAYTFFASDGAHHDGNNKYGSVARTFGTLDNPVGSAPPIDVIIHPNPDAAVNPNYGSYTYLGGGRIYRVPAGRPGAGSLLDVYHAEINTATSFYSLLGLAVSSDDGLHWTDLGEIANGTTQPTTATIVSLARAPIRSVLEAAFGEDPHAAAFEKYYEGDWTQPGIGGLSTDLNPSAGYAGSSNVAYDSAFGRYVMITDDTQHIAYAESVDGLSWTLPVLLEQDENSQTSFDYAVPIGMGDDPNLLAEQFYVFYTYGSAQGWPGNTVRRFTVTCQRRR